MKYTNLSGFALATLAATTLACSQAGVPPTSPAAANPVGSFVGPDGSTLKIAAPIAVSPADGIELDDDDPDLVITNVDGKFVQNLPLQYVFEVHRGSELVYRSAPVSPGGNGQTSHETAVVLNFDESYTWRAYGVYQGQRGPMSSASSFRTINRFGVSCAHMGTEPGIVECRRAQYGTIPHDGLPDFLRKVAYDLNRAGMEHRPYGLLIKTTGNNCHGYSCDIICAGQGGGQRQWDILIDEDSAQIPVWNRVGNAVSRACEVVQ
ncbi:MAG: hypothetical protein M3451_14210 [Chloroflexota bacterium]|nr:hypothetical protein [Acidobacteriota bacterium]MDQ3417541.1 hypothetical protein [Acidobacteriota bacterium]MDQ3526187.1 hypothetical protein [Chloroflexota bacterium]